MRARRGDDPDVLRRWLAMKDQPQDATALAANRKTGQGSDDPAGILALLDPMERTSRADRAQFWVGGGPGRRETPEQQSRRIDREMEVSMAMREPFVSDTLARFSNDDIFVRANPRSEYGGYYARRPYGSITFGPTEARSAGDLMTDVGEVLAIEGDPSSVREGELNDQALFSHELGHAVDDDPELDWLKMAWRSKRESDPVIRAAVDGGVRMEEGQDFADDFARAAFALRFENFIKNYEGDPSDSPMMKWRGTDDPMLGKDWLGPAASVIYDWMTRRLGGE